jgi:hypothetical protein
MPLVVPTLDTRTFAQLVTEIQRRIPTFTPEWTDLNDSDPGMTLAQLFAFMSEQLIYQVNQVPNKGFITFLQMVGAQLHPATPATADVTFLPIGATNSSSPLVIQIDEGTMVQTSAPPPGQTSALTFETVQAFTAINGSIIDLGSTNVDIQYTSFAAANASATGTFQPLNAGVSIRDTFYIVLDLNVVTGSPAWPAAAFQLRVNVAGSTDVGNPTNVALPGTPQHLSWSYSSGSSPVLGVDTVTWTPLTPTLDSTLELTQSGYLEFTFYAAGLMQRAASDVVPAAFQGHFVLRATQLSAGVYGSTPPVLKNILLNTVSALNLTTVQNEALGGSNGQPFQTFTLANAPVYPGSTSVTVYESSTGGGTFVTWTETLDLFSAGPTDRVYELIPATGELLFGDGTFGMIPPPDDGSQPNGNMTASQYQYGGGLSGNVGAQTLTKVVGPAGTTVTFDAINMLPAAGGDDEETAEDGIARAPAVVRSRYRAVSVADFEALAMETPNTRVSRANALANTRPGFASGTTPGAVTLVLVPTEPFATSINIPIPLPPFIANAVQTYLDQRRLVTTELFTEAATFRQVTITASLTLVAGASASAAQAAALLALNTYFNVYQGGDDGLGWPFGGTIYFSRVFQQLLDVPNVNLVENVQIALDSAAPVSCTDVPINPGELLYSGQHQLVITVPT